MVKSIQMQMMIAVTIIVGVVLGSVMLLLYWSNYQLVKTNLEEKFLKQAQALANGFDIHMQREKMVVTGFMKQATPKFTELSGDYAEAQRFVKQMHNDFPQWDPVTFFPDTTGKIAITSLDQIVDASRLEYVANFGQGAPFFSNPITSIVHGREIVVGVAPIIQADRVVGAMAGGMRLEIFTKDIDVARVGQNGYCILVSPNGMIVSQPRREAGVKQKLEELDVPALNQAFHAVKRGERGTLITEMDGQQSLVAYTPTADGWGVFVTIPTQEEFAPLIRLNTIFACLFFAGWLLTIYIINSILGSRCTGPVAYIAAAMRDLPQTSSQAEAKLLPPEFYGIAPIGKWAQELEQLHESFSQMSRQIQQQMETILTVTEKFSKAFRYASDAIGLVRLSDNQFIELSDAFFSHFWLCRTGSIISYFRRIRFVG